MARFLHAGQEGRLTSLCCRGDLKWEAPPAKVQVGLVRRWLGSSLEVLDCVLEVLEEEVAEAGVTWQNAVDLAPRDDLAGVAVEAVEPLIAVLDGQQVVREAILR